MSKKLVVLSGCALALLFASRAYSAEATVGPYVSANLGVAMPSDSDGSVQGNPVPFHTSYDTGWTLGAALGYNFGNIRAEGEVAYQKADEDKVGYVTSQQDSTYDKSARSFLVNGYYDFTNSSAFTPYLSAGLGYAEIKWSGDGECLKDSVFAWQVGAGVGYALSKNITIDATYRYFATSDPKFDVTEMEFASHNLLLGARFNF